MVSFNLTGKKLLAVGLVVVIGFALLIGVIAGAAQSDGSTQATWCSDPMLLSPVPQATPAATPTSGADNPCYSSSPYGSAVVSWAKKMADALYVNPACGRERGGPDCNDTYYTSAFPKAVIAYGQQWCQAHNDCADWANGSYQCVSFVRGAYSQVYPMKFTNNAFALWATYQNVPGWQELPSGATGDITQRFLPEPGDVMIFRDHFVGHVAIVMQVQAPTQAHNGWVEFANANSSSAYDRMPILPNLQVDTSAWTSTDPQHNNSYIVWGYLRPKPAPSAHPVVRLSQLDQAQYASEQEYTTWAYSACSAAAMTEVLNAYGHQYHIHDILAVESQLIRPGSSPPEAYITPEQGLTSDAGIAATMQQFGFGTTWGEQWTLAEVLVAANSGTPVIVSWPPDRYAGGHLVVITGGTTTTLTLADSSAYNRQTLSVTQFLAWWGGFAAVSTPLS